MWELFIETKQCNKCWKVTAEKEDKELEDEVLVFLKKKATHATY